MSWGCETAKKFSEEELRTALAALDDEENCGIVLRAKGIVAGADGKFVWADAKIDGKTVVVSSDQVKEPKYVRYAYMGYRGDCNLQNAEGLPAYPFRSDAVDYSKVK